MNFGEDSSLIETVLEAGLTKSFQGVGEEPKATGPKNFLTAALAANRYADITNKSFRALTSALSWILFHKVSCSFLDTVRREEDPDDRMIDFFDAAGDDDDFAPEATRVGMRPGVSPLIDLRCMLFINVICSFCLDNELIRW